MTKMNIDKVILSYSDYLYGASLPMYDLQLTETDFNDEPELDVITKATCWLDVLDKSSDVDFNQLSERLGKSISEKLKAYVKDYNQLWTVMGYKHYWYIKNYRKETGDKSSYFLINKIL